MFCPYKYDQQLQIISDIITKSKLRKTLKWQVHDHLHVKRQTGRKKKEKHAVPCTSVGQVFIVSASETKSVQHSPLVTNQVDGFKTEPT